MSYIDNGFNLNLQRDPSVKPTELSGLDYDALIQELQLYKSNPTGQIDTSGRKLTFNLDENRLSILGNNGANDVSIGQQEDGSYGAQFLNGTLTVTDKNGNTLISPDGLSTSNINFDKFNIFINPTAFTFSSTQWITGNPAISFTLEKNSPVLVFYTGTATTSSIGQYALVRLLIDGQTKIPSQSGIVLIAKDEGTTNAGDPLINTISMMYIVNLNAGSHNIASQYIASGIASFHVIGADESNTGTFLGYLVLGN